MKKVSKIAALIAAATLLFGSAFVGCHFNSDSNKEETDQTPPNKPDSPNNPDDTDDTDDTDDSKAQEIVEKKIDGHLMDGTVSDSVPYSIVYNPNSFISGNNKVYSKEISKLCAVFAADVYDSIGFVDKKEAYSSDRKINDEYFASLLGLTDIARVDLKPEEYEVDKNDITSAIFSHQLYRGTDENYEIIFAAVQGTNGTTAQWSSNFDIGSDTASYYATTGEHPDWINKNHAKGFDVSATRLDRKLQDYIASKIDKNAKKIIVLTGHSRGAGIANILGAKYSKDSNFKCFTYCFAAPRVTTSSDIASYDSIFNISNTDDLVTEVPMRDPKFGFNQYGIEKSASIKDTYSDDWVAFVNSGDKKLDDGNKPKYTKYESANGAVAGACLAGLCDSRDEIHEYTDENEYEKIFDEDETQEESRFVELSNDETFKKFIKVEKIEDKKYTVRYCSGSVLQIFAFLISGNMNPFNAFEDIIYENEKIGEVISDLMVEMKILGVPLSHAQETYLLLADKLE